MAFIHEELKILEYNYPFADKINHLLQEQIRGLNDTSHQPSNINAHFTGWNLNSKETTNLVRWVGDLISRDFVGNCYSSTSVILPTLKCSELWGVLYKEGDYITEHQHSPSLFSFVYYVNAPKGSSPLVFVTSRRKIKAEAGKVVIFESRLIHKVPPNKCKNRCVISGNFIYNKQTGVYGVSH